MFSLPTLSFHFSLIADFFAFGVLALNLPNLTLDQPKKTFGRKVSFGKKSC